MDLLTRLAQALGRFSARYVPSAFTIAVLLTGLTFALALAFGGATPASALSAWSGGFWKLLEFSMQMALVMFTGYLVALTPPVRKGLEAVARLATSPRAAVVLVALVSMVLAYVNWGLSIIASALLVRFVVRQQPRCDYRLLVACAYFGLGATWHAGLSASAPLTVATPGHFLEATLGVVPLSATLFSSFNLALVFVSVVVLALLAFAMHPDDAAAVTVDPKLLDAFEAPPAPPEAPGEGPAAWLDSRRWLTLTFGAVMLVAFALTVRETGWRKLNINSVNFLFLSLAILLHPSAKALLKSADEAASTLAGVVLQFPLYAGMYGLFSGTELTRAIGEAFVSVSTQKTFPLLVYLYSGFVNYFVPSGGAKWAIEGPYLLEAAKTLAVAPEKVVLAYAWGDMATDLIQPFWAVPLLSIARLEFKDVLGFLLVAFFVYVPLVGAAFLLWA